MTSPEQKKLQPNILSSHEWIVPSNQEREHIMQFWLQVPAMNEHIMQIKKQTSYQELSPQDQVRTRWEACMQYLSEHAGITALEATIYHRLSLEFTPSSGSIYRVMKVLKKDMQTTGAQEFLTSETLHLAEGQSIPISPYQKKRLLERIDLVFDNFQTADKNFQHRDLVLRSRTKRNCIHLLHPEQNQEYLNILADLPLQHSMHKRWQYVNHDDVATNPPRPFTYEPILYQDYYDDLLYSLNRFINSVNSQEHNNSILLESVAKEWLTQELRYTNKTLYQQQYTLNQVISLLTRANIIGLYRVKESNAVYIYSDPTIRSFCSSEIQDQLTKNNYQSSSASEK